MVEVATEKQTQGFYDLWKKCFEDSDKFSKWLFEKRFLPDYCTYIQKDGKIVCCMQAYPLHIVIREKTVKGVMLCGVCTDPNYRKQGLMTELFSHTMRYLRQKGFVIAVHTPAVLQSYYPFGHFAVNRCKYITSENVADFQKCEAIQELKQNFRILYSCYEKFSQKYSGCISRTMADFLIKIEDYRIDGAKIIVYESDKDIKGYAVFYCTEEMLQGVEVIAESDEIYQKLIEGICSYGKGLRLSVKLPETVNINIHSLEQKIEEKGVAGVLDIQKLMSALGQKKGYAIAIEDSVIEQNNGVFDLDGTPSTKLPDMKLSAGKATQLLLGYCSLYDLQKQNDVVIYHNENAQKIANFYQKQNCFIVDEY